MASPKAVCFLPHPLRSPERCQPSSCPPLLGRRVKLTTKSDQGDLLLPYSSRSKAWNLDARLPQRPSVVFAVGSKSRVARFASSGGPGGGGESAGV